MEAEPVKNLTGKEETVLAEFEVPKSDKREEQPHRIQKAKNRSKNPKQLDVPFNDDFPVKNFVLVILDDHPDDSSFCILKRSSLFCGIPVSFDYTSDNKTFKVSFDGNKKNPLIWEENGENESEARERTCNKALKVLSENCYQISLKNKEDIIDVKDNTKMCNVRHEVLGAMGWSADGLGKECSGLPESMTVENVIGRQGMENQGSKEVGKDFKKKIETIITELTIGSCGCYDLVFTGFDSAQREVINDKARRSIWWVKNKENEKKKIRLGLKSVSFGKGVDRQTAVTKKFDLKSLIEGLLQNDRETEKYMIKPPDNLVEKFMRL